MRMRRFMQKRQADTVFTRSRTLISKARESGDVRAVYYHMIQLFADKYQVSPTVVSQAFIEEKLKNAQLSQNLLVEWQKFFMHLSACVYDASRERASSALFLSALQWIDILEKYL